MSTGRTPEHIPLASLGSTPEDDLLTAAETHYEITLAVRRLDITLAAIGRQVEKITEHLGLVTDEDGAPVVIEPFAPAGPPDRHLLLLLIKIRNIAGNVLVADAQAGARIRALLFPRHIHDDDGTVEGCPGCFPSGEVIPPAITQAGLAEALDHELDSSYVGGRELAVNVFRYIREQPFQLGQSWEAEKGGI